MVRVSNAFLAIFSCLTLLVGVVAVGAGLYFLASGSQNPCERGVQNPLMILGSALFFISLLGLIGACARVNFILKLYLIVLFLLILGMIVFTIFTILVTNEGAGEALSKTKITYFRHWVNNHLMVGKNWEEMKHCLIEAKVCKTLVHVNKQSFSPLQSGCCQPPPSCGFESKNATFQLERVAPAAAKDSDCQKWSNEQQTLCYNCDSCKAGFVNNIRKEWSNLAIFNACVTAFAIILCCFGCCAKRNNSEDSYYGYGSRYRSHPRFF